MRAEELRAALDGIVPGLPYTPPVARVLTVLLAKGASAPAYWRDRGRGRFERELAEDGVPAALVGQVLDVVDVELDPDAVDLDAILRELQRRNVGGRG